MMPGDTDCGTAVKTFWGKVIDVVDCIDFRAAESR